MSKAPPTPIIVTDKQLRQLFNDECFYWRMKRGEFTEFVFNDCRPRPDILRDYGPDTRSQGIIYRDRNGDDIVMVHQYVDPQGNILYIDKDTGILMRDGLPDPKSILWHGNLYLVPVKEKG